MVKKIIKFKDSFVVRRIAIIVMLFGGLLLLSMIMGLSTGSTDTGLKQFVLSLFKKGAFPDSLHNTIIWQIRLPRVLVAALAGATLSLGGLVFQALLRNPLAEPYILGVSGGSAIGAIIGIMFGFSRFPGVGITAFTGSMATLLMIIVMTSGKNILSKDSLILAGVMINAFCSAIIMFLVSITRDSKLHSILFWLMGDFSMTDIKQVQILALVLVPCFIIIFYFSHCMNLMVMGNDMAKTMGVNIRAATLTMILITSFMISATVCQAGLIGFVGLVIPHMLRIVLGPDHRILVPASIFGGGAYMVLCDLLSRILPKHGEMPVGVITAIIGAPLFIILLKRNPK